MLSTVALAVVGLAGGCSADGGSSTVTVFAASSLTDAFEDLAAEFERRNSAVDVELSFGASSSLREQILAGAPADVLASANVSTMDELVDAGAATDPHVFATNRLQLAVPRGNPAGITALADLARARLLVGLCAPEVPCGDYARRALASAGVEAAIDTNAADARALLTQLAAGELDAGIVYRTDVLAAGGDVEGIDLPSAHDVEVEHPIAVLTEAEPRDAADAFVAFVRSPVGSATLAEHGFSVP